MASNVEKQYLDRSPAAKLDQKTLNKMVWRSLFLQTSFNMERMQSCGWLYAILPGLEKIHTKKEDLSLAMEHNLEFFNVHPFLVTFVMGIILSLEQQKADINTIRSVRVALMGPLGGIGDAIFWFTLLPITAGITGNMALQGNFIAPVLFLLIFNGVQMWLRFYLMNMSYRLGEQSIGIFTQNAREFKRGASILGVFIVGALVSLYSNTTTRWAFANGKKVVDGQEVVKYIELQGILDKVFPKLLPLGIVLLLFFFFTKKKWKPLHAIVFLFVLATLGVCVGFFSGDYTSLIFDNFKVQ